MNLLYNMIFRHWWWSAHTLLWTMLLPVIYLIIKKSKPRLSLFVLLFYFMLVFTVTGSGVARDLIHPPGTLNLDLIPFRTGLDAQNILNIIMTIPFGFLVALLWDNYRSWKKIAVLGFAFSALIEASQLLNWRVTATEDLITNTLGAVIGYFIFKVFCANMTQRKPSAPGTPLTLLLLAFIGVFIFSGFQILPQSWQPQRQLHPGMIHEAHNGIIIERNGSDTDEGIDY